MGEVTEEKDTQTCSFNREEDDIIQKSIPLRMILVQEFNIVEVRTVVTCCVPTPQVDAITPIDEMEKLRLRGDL